MTLPATQIWEVQTGGSDSLNGGGFDPGNANMATDGACTLGNTSAPVFTSASYNFVASDVGAWLYIKSGTNWIPGWYKIASVASNAATLTAGVGTAVLAWIAGTLNIPTTANTIAGCATVASPTGATWSVDYSQQSNPISLTGLTTAAANAIILTASATKAMVGNTIQITAGTNFTVGFYSISSVVAGVSLTVDRTCTSAAGAVGTGGVGGALLTIGKAAGAVVSGNIVYVKAGAGYTITTAIVHSIIVIRYTGYGTLRNDGVQVAVTGSGTPTNLFNITASNCIAENFNFDGANVTSTVVASNQTEVVLRNCKIQRFTSIGVNLNVNNNLFDCEITGGKAGSSGAYSSASANNIIESCSIHDNPCTGIVLAAGLSYVTIANCLIYNNSGASSDGINAPNTSVGLKLLGNTIYNNGRDGIRYVGAQGAGVGTIIRNNLIVSNAGVGFNVTALSTTYPCAAPYADYNAFYANGTARTGNVGGLHDVSLTADPFTAKGSGDFSLNNTAGGGAACRGAGFPGVFPAGLTTGHLDIGAVQHADPATTPLAGNMAGGFVNA